MKCFVIGLPCLNYAHCITAVFCEAHPLSSMDTCIISEADGRSKLFQKSIRGPTKLISLWACSSNCVWAQRTENIAGAQLQRHFTRRTIGDEQIKVRGETDQGWEPNPYHASWRIWKPRPSRIVFLFPIERIRIPNTTVWKGQTLIRVESIVHFDIERQRKSQNKN